MENDEHWVIDGTFKSAPHLFTQLFTVHKLLPDGWYLPFSYGLLPGKTTTLYRNLLQEIDSLQEIDQPQFVGLYLTDAGSPLLLLFDEYHPSSLGLSPSCFWMPTTSTQINRTT